MADTDRCSKREVVTRTRRVSRRGVSLVSMGESVIIGPVAGCPHLRTIVWLPCFMWCAKELVHARLGMIAAAGFLAQEAVTKATWGTAVGLPDF